MLDIGRQKIQLAGCFKPLREQFIQAKSPKNPRKKSISKFYQEFAIFHLAPLFKVCFVKYSNVFEYWKVSFLIVIKFLLICHKFAYYYSTYSCSMINIWVPQYKWSKPINTLLLRTSKRLLDIRPDIVVVEVVAVAVRRWLSVEVEVVEAEVEGRFSVAEAVVVEVPDK